jgi:hypothetical protein
MFSNEIRKKFFLFCQIFIFGIVSFWFLKRFSRILLAPGEYQWDLFCYFASVKGYFLLGLDPYLIDKQQITELGISHVTMGNHPFLYPIPCLYLLYPFIYMSWNTAFYSMFFLKISVFIAAQWAFYKTFIPKEAPLPSYIWVYVWMLMGLSGTIGGDIESGNVALLISSSILFAFVALQKKAHWAFVLCILLASSLKIYPILFALAPIFLSSGSKKWQIPLLTIGMFIGLFTFGYLIEPIGSSDFFSKVIPTIQERTFHFSEPFKDNNTGLMRLSHDIIYMWKGQSLQAEAWTSWFILALFFAIISMRVLFIPRVSFAEKVCLMIITYGLISPRSLLYNYTLYLLPGLFILSQMKNQNLAKLIIVLSSLPAFHPFLKVLSRLWPSYQQSAVFLLIDHSASLTLCLLWGLSIKTLLSYQRVLSRQHQK